MNFVRRLKAIDQLPLITGQYYNAQAMAEQSAFGSCAFHITDRVELDGISMYIRFRTNQQRLWMHPVLILASIDIEHQGCGIFTELLAEAQRVCRENKWVLQIENVLEQRFRRFLFDRSFETIGVDKDCAHGSMFWFFDEKIKENATQFQAMEENIRERAAAQKATS
ncbi:hypothetical protein pEaSNUABM46_00270 [Erwinia phage pEa_SNUABM_46]|nr:hypothetical protein pEaSNUABM45_00270 [Erwinia phage pEa_SNUABM_45]QYW04254.1 hypothetical protein pEaSNUABM46_00270 [Erwinia phage pEa_SNUABM_46]